MKNVLVLENIGSLDYEINRYLQLEHATDNVKKLFHLSSIPKAELHAELIKADCICVQSLFADRAQMRNFVLMLSAYPNITEIRIIHGYTTIGEKNALLQLLNLKIQEFYKDVVSLIESKKVYEVVCRIVDVTKDDGEIFKHSFRKLELQYDVVPLYVNYDIYKSMGIIWHEWQPCPDKESLKFYKAIHPQQKQPEKGSAIRIEDEDLPAFKELMNELRSVVEYQKESCEIQDFGNSDILIEEKNNWLEIMDKYKL